MSGMAGDDQHFRTDENAFRLGCWFPANGGVIERGSEQCVIDRRADAICRRIPTQKRSDFAACSNDFDVKVSADRSLRRQSVQFSWPVSLSTSKFIPNAGMVTQKR